MSNEYREFVRNKVLRDKPTGFDDIPELNPMLFDWQDDVVSWALKRGRAAIFADCGLGKTPMQLEWAKHVTDRTGKPILVVAPLAVASQTVREGEKFGIDIEHIRGPAPVDTGNSGLYIVNYEMLEKFNAQVFGGIVLDESSILKSHSGKYRNLIIEMFKDTPYRLACTATPAPNDHMELANHSEFLGIMDRQEMLATFFVHDSSNTQQWRLKGHAEDEFWEWMASWAVSITKPSDIGYEDDRYQLPDLNMSEHKVKVDRSEDAPEGMLFRPQAVGLSGINKEQKRTIEDRADKVADLVKEKPGEHWIVWCNRNAEAKAVCDRIDDAVEIRGSHSSDLKSKRMKQFSEGDIRVLVTKPSIAGFGMNWQHCHNVAFVGLSYSYEQFYQALRRCYRFGQDKEVNAHVVVAETEGQVLDAIKRKKRESQKMNRRMTDAMSKITIDEIGKASKDVDNYTQDHASGDGWDLYLGDCVEVAKDIESESVGCSVFSPPFSNLYTYSNSPRDMGNSKNDGEFFDHFGYLIDELMRITMPGRNCVVHCADIKATKTQDGYMGVKDFTGDIIREFEKRGWVYFSRITIWKDPVTTMQRTKSHRLLYKTLLKDSAKSGQNLPDYLLVFRKEGENPKPIEHTEDEFPLEEWRELASHCWTDIDQTDVLNYREARDEKDERHICPLQLEVIERALRLWSAEGDLVFSPFAGIGSEGYTALNMGRKFVGAELKPSYWQQARNNLKRVTEPDPQVSLDELAAE